MLCQTQAIYLGFLFLGLLIPTKDSHHRIGSSV